VIKNTNKFELQKQILTSLKFACIKKIKDGENCTYSFTGKYRVRVLLFYKRVTCYVKKRRPYKITTTRFDGLLI